MSDTGTIGPGGQDGQRGEAHLFMVRLWQEQRGKRTLWRGRVQHVVTGRVRLLNSSASLRQLAELADCELDIPLRERNPQENR